MSDAHRFDSRPWRLPILWLLVLIAAASEATASEPSQQISSADITEAVVSALPQSQGQTAKVVATLDLTQPFETRTHWALVMAILPGSHFEAAGAEPLNGGALAQCFVENLTPHCTYGTPTRDFEWFATPVEVYSIQVVFRGESKTSPLLMIKTGSAQSGDGGHAIFTNLLVYDRQQNKFESVFSNSTGSNNNQNTRFVTDGLLRGDVIVDEPENCCYRIEVYRLGAAKHFVSILSYRGRTVYGDRNPLAVSDSEMPEILRRLGLWHRGDPLPVPPQGCTPVLRRGEEWCQ